MTFLSPTQRLARKAGFLYFLLVPLGIFALLYVPEQVLIPTDAAQTLANIAHHESLFRAGILGAFAIQVVQLFVALALYDLLKPAGKRMASYIVLFTLAAMPIALLNELSHVAILYLINDSSLALSLGMESTEQLVLWLMKLNADGIMIAHVFWGFWLFPMGYLIVKSRIIPQWIGYLFVLASAGYVVDTIGWFALPNLNISMASYTGWAEIILPLWLMIKGVNEENWDAMAEPA